MTNLAEKAGVPTNEKETRPFLILDANGRHVVGVDKAKLLGDGYVLMKISTSQVEPEVRNRETRIASSSGESISGKAATSGQSPGMNATPSITDLPEIDDRQVMRLFEKIRSRLDAVSPLAADMINKTRRAKTATGGDPLAENKRVMEEMRAQEKRNREQDVCSGALLKSAEFLAARGISRQSLSKAVGDKRVFFIEGDSGVRLYPAFFADPKNDRVALEKVSKELGDLPGASKLQFFTTKQLSLGSVTPVEAIKKGQIQKVLAAATGFREQ